jgi:hypothetical protein
MKITPIDENEYSSRNLWADGVYPCSIVECEEGASKKTGAAFFKMKVQLFNEENQSTNLFYYMMAEGNAAWQLRAGVEALGLLDNYRAGEISADDFYQKTAYAFVGHQSATDQYPAKNIIKGFRADPPANKTSAPVKPAQKVQQLQKKQSVGSFDDLMDDIPL